MERENAPTARIGIKAVGEEGFGAGAFVGEWKRRFPRREAKWNARDILGRIALRRRERGAFGLGLDRADGFAIHEQRVVGLAGFECKFADRHSRGSGEIDLILRLNCPAALLKKRVDFLTR